MGNLYILKKYSTFVSDLRNEGWKQRVESGALRVEEARVEQGTEDADGRKEGRIDRDGARRVEGGVPRDAEIIYSTHY
ncbi:MAG: hypothetical protein ACI4BD_07920 [Paludibacteraceae bacterium]